MLRGVEIGTLEKKMFFKPFTFSIGAHTLSRSVLDNISENFSQMSQFKHIMTKKSTTAIKAMSKDLVLADMFWHMMGNIHLFKSLL